MRRTTLLSAFLAATAGCTLPGVSCTALLAEQASTGSGLRTALVDEEALQDVKSHVALSPPVNRGVQGPQVLSRVLGATVVIALLFVIMKCVLVVLKSRGTSLSDRKLATGGPGGDQCLTQVRSYFSRPRF